MFRSFRPVRREGALDMAIGRNRFLRPISRLSTLELVDVLAEFKQGGNGRGRENMINGRNDHHRSGCSTRD
jgi:hypothetical protein